MADGQLAYLIKRFDRLKTKKIYVEDFCQLSEKLTESKYRSSLEKAGKLIKQYSEDAGLDTSVFFDLNYFCYLIGNNDMHLKNFSLWEDTKQKKIRLSPAYDLLSVRLLISEKEDPEQTALAINGKKNNVKKSDWISLGQNLGLQENLIEAIFDKHKKNLNRYKKLIESSFLSKERQKKLISLISSQAF